MYKLVVSELAHRDLDDIISYIAEELANPDAARDFIKEVIACYRNLKANPLMYEKCRDNRLKAEGYRKALIKSYVAVYKVNEEIKTVTILRFFYSARDYVKLI